ncbi:MAG: DNA methyltransferase [Armatimonadota bacterium]
MPDRLPYDLTWTHKRAPRRVGSPPTLELRDLHGESPGSDHRLILGDNLAVMEALLPELAGKIDLVYLDPPFAAGHPFTMTVPLGEGNGSRQVIAYDDTWEPSDYLQMLYDRLALVRELLSETGSLVVHVNWRVGHLAQVILDELFGPGERAGAGRPGFRNEIVWGYGGGGAAATTYRRKHDNLFWYTRGRRWTFNPQYRPYSAGTRERGLTAVKGPRYSLRDEGATLETWWTGPEVQKILSPTARENRKYPTQKPESLLERILLGHSQPGDLVADFFCGSGTTGAVAARLGRRSLLVDSSTLAVHVTRKRWAGDGEEPGTPFRCEGIGPVSAAGVLSARAVRTADGHVSVYVERFEPAGGGAAGDGLDLLDYWAVDWSGGGRAVGAFHHQWHSLRDARGRGLCRQSPARPTSGRTIAVKGFDLFGGECFTTLELE